jgi:hypothetical protein
VAEYFYKFQKGILKPFPVHKREDLDPELINNESKTAIDSSMSSDFQRSAQDSTFGANDRSADDTFGANDRTDAFSANDRTGLSQDMQKKISLEAQATQNHECDGSYDF